MMSDTGSVCGPVKEFRTVIVTVSPAVAVRAGPGTVKGPQDPKPASVHWANPHIVIGAGLLKLLAGMVITPAFR